MSVSNNQWRIDFPALSGTMNGKPLTFLDSGASAQKPQIVLDTMMAAMRDHYANIHRGLYAHSQEMTAEFEAVRGKVAGFINAASDHEIVFTRNTTEAINLVAQSWGRAHLQAGDEILITEMEHHANIVPWQLLETALGVVVKYVPVLDDGGLDLSALSALLTERTKMLAFVHISNVLGTVNPAADIIKTVKAFNPDIMTLVDASQSAVHMALDVQALGCDFLCLTGHKLYGPNGIGVLYGRYDVLETMPPYQGGGDMIEHVSVTGSTFKAPPARFEAGTPAIAEVIALGAAVDYVQGIGFDAITRHESGLSRRLHKIVQDVEGATIIGNAPGKAGICAFTIDGVHPSDLAALLDGAGVAVRTGHHCCEPLTKRFEIPSGSTRASLALYNDESDLERFEAALNKAVGMLR